MTVSGAEMMLQQPFIAKHVALFFWVFCRASWNLVNTICKYIYIMMNLKRNKLIIRLGKERHKNWEHHPLLPRRHTT